MLRVPWTISFEELDDSRAKMALREQILLLNCNGPTIFILTVIANGYYYMAAPELKVDNSNK